MNSRLQPLSPEQHLGMGLRTDKDWTFCQTLDAAPIALTEFANMVGSQPIVFSIGPMPQPLAIFGMQPGKNDFLDLQHQWPAHYTVPNVLLHHPFSIAQDQDNPKRAVMCVDTTASRFVPLEDDESALPLFTFDGRPTPMLSGITQQLGAHWSALQEAIAFGQALNKAGLLEDVCGNVRLSDGSTHTTRTFRRVNASAFRALPEAELTRWFRQGWTDAIALHLASLNRWMQLFERHQRSNLVMSPKAHDGE
ncbi:SapC family protein [Comamonas sp. MYb69]|uniref:SapC family protein n=1 Tax=Comamonas sp. MYb69 TaxID=1848650 RepID=UPI003094F8F2